MVTSGPSLEDSWFQLLNRPFKGLESSMYRDRFESEISDPNLRAQGLASLANAGNEQQFKYDFSVHPWLQKIPENGSKGKFKFANFFFSSICPVNAELESRTIEHIADPELSTSNVYLKLKGHFIVCLFHFKHNKLWGRSLWHLLVATPSCFRFL